MEARAVSDCSWGSADRVGQCTKIKQLANAWFSAKESSFIALWVASMLRAEYLPDDDDVLVDCKHAFAPFKFIDHFTAGISRPSELTTMKSYYCAWPSEDVCFGWFMSDLSRNASFWQFYLGGVQLAKWNLRGSVRKRVPFRHTP